MEKDVTRNIASFLSEKLIQNGYDIEFFQQKESVNEVVEKEKRSNSSLFLSIHCNSANNPLACGTEALYYPDSGTGKAVAEIISKKISEKFKLKNRGAKPKKEFRVLNGTNAPAVLVELAFLSNLEEEKLLLNSAFVFANAIFEGIEEWMK